MTNTNSAPTDKTFVQRGGDCDCTTAEDLLAKLSPRHDFWQPDPSAWVFRGQRTDRPLYPTAYRKDGDQFKEFGVTCPPDSSWEELGEAHKKVHDLFHRGLDRAGLGIPTTQPKVDFGPSESSYQNEVSPPAYPLMALAQHVGLPTQLLDWSLHSRVAAYFAAASAAKKRTDEKMVVWALNSNVVREGLPREGGTIVVLMTAPRSSNPNLHAQSGVFTWIRGAEPHVLPLDQHIEKGFARYPSSPEIEPPHMRKLTLPGACAPKLLRLLSYEGVDGSVVYPGYVGVVKAMKERALWDE